MLLIDSIDPCRGEMNTAGKPVSDGGRVSMNGPSRRERVHQERTIQKGGATCYPERTIPGTSNSSKHGFGM